MTETPPPLSGILHFIICLAQSGLVLLSSDYLICMLSDFTSSSTMCVSAVRLSFCLLFATNVLRHLAACLEHFPRNRPHIFTGFYYSTYMLSRNPTRFSTCSHILDL